jgi:DNA-directed RNA polymerase specialized sigma24 family protein
LEVKDTIDWNELLNGVHRGDSGVLEELMETLAVRLLPIAKYRLIGWRHEDIEDIVQDTLITVYEKLDQIESDPDYYALSVLKNKIGNAYQRWQRRRKVVFRMDADRHDNQGSPLGEFTVSQVRSEDDFLSNFESKDIANYLKEAIRMLPEFCQTFFLMLLSSRTVQDMWKSTRQTEQTLTRNAFDKRLYDCRQKLTDLVKDQI